MTEIDKITFFVLWTKTVSVAKHVRAYLAGNRNLVGDLAVCKEVSLLVTKQRPPRSPDFNA
jgi:hypothetical protein